MSEAGIGSFVSMSRRGALLAALASSQLACRSGAGASEHAATGGTSASASASSASTGSAPAAIDSGSLEVATEGRMREDERGGVAVVLLHGWGASGDDLVLLARALARPRTR